MGKHIHDSKRKNGAGQQLLRGHKLSAKQPILESMRIMAERMLELLSRANETYIFVLAAHTQHKRKLQVPYGSPPPWDLAEQAAWDNRNYVEACTQEFAEFFSAPLLAARPSRPGKLRKKQ